MISSNAPHIHFVADTIGALGWIVSGDRPSHFIRESYDGGKHHVKNIPGEKNNIDNMSPHFLQSANVVTSCIGIASFFKNRKKEQSVKNFKQFEFPAIKCLYTFFVTMLINPKIENQY